jgi:hypothetical protein
MATEILALLEKAGSPGQAHDVCSKKGAQPCKAPILKLRFCMS